MENNFKTEYKWIKTEHTAEGLTKQFYGAVVVNKSFMAPAHVNILNKCFFSYFEKLQLFQKELLFLSAHPFSSQV